MKVLTFGNIPSWAGGRNDNGLSNVIYQLASNMARVENVDITLVATDVNEESLKRDGLRIIGWTKPSLLGFAALYPIKTLYYFCNVIVYKIRFRQPESVLGLVFKMLQLNKCIMEIKPDVVHLHGAGAIIYLNAIPKSIKPVLTIHGILGNDFHFDEHENYAKLEKACCKSLSIKKLYFISSKLIDDFSKEYGTIIPPSETILNAYDNKTFYLQNGCDCVKGLTLVTVATLSHIKGQERVLQALSKTKLDYNYECVGGDSDNLTEQLESFAQKEGIKYKYYGKKSPADINNILASADFMILPSSTEGFGLVYLEAIACGVPVVLPKDLPLVKEPGIIIPGVNAVLLEDYTVDSIAKVLPLLKQMSFNRLEVSKTVSNINWGKIAHKYALSFAEI